MHTDNGLDDAQTFMYWRHPYKIPIHVPLAIRDIVIQIADRFAPVLLVFHDRIEIDWDFYAGSSRDYQLLMNHLFLAIGIYSTVREGNIEIVHRNHRDVSGLFPKVSPYEKPMFFHASRYADALEYIKRSSVILKHHPLKPSPHELFAITHPRPRIESVEKKFNPNEITAEIIITDKWPWPVAL